MPMSTDDDLRFYQPDIDEWTIQEFPEEHEKARQDILRRLRREWWPSASARSLHASNAFFVSTVEEMDETKLDETQFTKAACYLIFAEYIGPKLTKFEPSGDEDRFQGMMKYYKSMYNEEFAAILEDGVEYDFDGDGLVEDEERESDVTFGRLDR